MKFEMKCTFKASKVKFILEIGLKTQILEMKCTFDMKEGGNLWFISNVATKKPKRQLRQVVNDHK